MSVRRTVRGARIRADRHRRLRSPQGEQSDVGFTLPVFKGYAASRCAWCLSQRTSQRPADLSRGQSAGLSAEQRDSAITVRHRSRLVCEQSHLTDAGLAATAPANSRCHSLSGPCIGYAVRRLPPPTALCHHEITHPSPTLAANARPATALARGRGVPTWPAAHYPRRRPWDFDAGQRAPLRRTRCLCPPDTPLDGPPDKVRSRSDVLEARDIQSLSDARTVSSQDESGLIVRRGYEPG